MTENSTFTRKWCLLLIGLAVWVGLIFLQSCTNAQQFPKIIVTTVPPTVLPSSTPAPSTSTGQPGFTPTKTTTRMILSSPIATQGTTPTNTPFPRGLAHYFLKYNPKATPDMPPAYSISSWDMWRSIIPATPVAATPQFIAYPPPAELATNAQDLFIQAGCVSDQYNIACPPESPLSRFDCRRIFTDLSWLAYPAAQDISLVAQCFTKIDYREKAPDDLYFLGCAFQSKAGYIFKIQEEYVLANTIEQMQELFLPIESASAALSYAQMMTGLRADFTPSFDPTLLYLQASIQGTHVTEVDGSYIMNLYHNHECGCEPWITSEVMLQVDRDGTITWKSARPVYFTTGYSCAD